MDEPDPQNHYLHNIKLTGYAKRMRRKGTKAEAYLWKFALKNRIMGYKFLRQRPVMEYIADFMCPELRLIIETDGATHMLDGAAEKDRKRQQILEQAGFTVLRFEDGMVLNNLSVTLSVIEQEVERLAAERKHFSPLSFGHLPEGENLR